MKHKDILSPYLQQKSFLIILHCVLWLGVICFVSIDLSSTGNMIENYSWGQFFQWGSNKHPPLTGWIVSIWFHLFPTTHLWYYLLSYLNVALALYGIINTSTFFYEGVPVLKDRYTWWVLAFCTLSFAYGPWAALFNADSIQLAIWPWSTYVFLLCIESRTSRPYQNAVILGILCGLGMLGKYYFAVLLLTFFIITVTNEYYRSWYKSPYPYIASVVMLSVLTPHFMWLYQFDFPPFHYLTEQTINKSSLFQKSSFLLTGLINQGIAWIVCLYFIKRYKLHIKILFKGSILSGKNRTLLLLVILPSLITTILCICINSKVVLRWSIPIWFALPILMTKLLTSIIDKPSTDTFSRLIIHIWSAILFLAITFLFFIVFYAHPHYFKARKELANIIQNEYISTYPGKPLFKWVVGQWPDPAALAFYLPFHPHAMPGFPDEYLASLNPENHWQNENGVLFCLVKHPSFNREKNHLNYKKFLLCKKNTEHWLKSHHFSIHKKTIHFKSSDWRAKYSQKRMVTIYWHLA